MDTRQLNLEHQTRTTAPTVVAPARTGGAHRLPAPPHALHGRAAVLALAAGGAVAAGGAGAAFEPTGSGDEVVLLASGQDATAGTPPIPARSSGPAPSAPFTLTAGENTGTQAAMAATLAAATEINSRREIAEEQARRPKVVLPANGAFTSRYEMRWGVFHGGIDLAGPPGSPEFAAQDGLVVDAGPAQGFGQWVRIMADDGTMTVYGHMSKVLVTKGQRVTAGQTIALMGSEGFSTGSHLHFEVWVSGGRERVDPERWLLQHGVPLPPYSG